jgi:hypothetical protein
MPVGSTGVDGCSGRTWQQMTWPQHWQPLQLWLGRNLWLVVCLDSYGPCWTGIFQRPVRMHLWPQTIVQPRYTMEHPILVKVTVQLALHIATTDRRECNARPGMMWAFLAAAGNSGRSRVQVCIDCALSPFGRQVTRGTLAVQMLVTGTSVVRK